MQFKGHVRIWLGNNHPRRSQADVALGEDWTTYELRHSFVSLVADQLDDLVKVADLARPRGHPHDPGVPDRNGVAYVVIGGMAAAMWGADLPRTTDADIVPASEGDNLERLAAALSELGARLRVHGEPQGVAAPLDAEQLSGSKR